MKKNKKQNSLIRQIEKGKIIYLYEHKGVSFFRKFFFYPIILCLLLYFIYTAFIIGNSYQTVIFWLVIWLCFVAAFLFEIFQVQKIKPNLILTQEGIEDLVERVDKKHDGLILWKNVKRCSLLIESYFPLIRALDIEIKKDGKTLGFYMASRHMDQPIKTVNQTINYFIEKHKK